MSKVRSSSSPAAHPALPLIIAAPVQRALADGAPVVALESTLVTHGLAFPANLRAAQAAEAAVRSAGAQPATIALHDRRVLVGLDEEQLAALARQPGESAVAKVSRATLALALQSGGWGGTTVAATMICAGLAGIRVFATGGIGGVHRGGERTLDISADLDELARTPLLVVCSGPKSILDVDLTLEYLETRGVPIVGWDAAELPGFFARESGRSLAGSVADARAAAELATAHWRLGLGSGLVVAAAVPEDAALERDEAETAIARAVAEADEQRITGGAATPWVLARVAELTEGRSVRANLALIENNARIAGQIAVELANLVS